MNEAAQDTWAYQNASDLADHLVEGSSDLFNAISDEEHPDDLVKRVDKLESKLEDLRTELDEMPRF